MLLKLGLPKSVYQFIHTFHKGLPYQGGVSHLKVVLFDSDKSLFYVFICVDVHMHGAQRTFGD